MALIPVPIWYYGCGDGDGDALTGWPGVVAWVIIAALFVGLAIMIISIVRDIRSGKL